jgi:hypothetical protein
MAAIAAALASSRPATIPPLRQLHDELKRGDGAVDPVLAAQLDEIVDAVNSVAALVHLTPARA